MSLVSGRTTFLLKGELSMRWRSMVCFTRLEMLLAYRRPCKGWGSARGTRHEGRGLRVGRKGLGASVGWAVLEGRARCAC